MTQLFLPLKETVLLLDRLFFLAKCICTYTYRKVHTGHYVTLFHHPIASSPLLVAEVLSLDGALSYVCQGSH